MSLHRLLEEFATRCARCATREDLFALTEAAARELGFDRLAMVHGLWFRQPSRKLIRMDNFGEYADVFIARKFYRDDPALLACQRTNTAFRWTEIGQLVPLSPKAIAILSEAARYGLTTGMSLPIGVTGEPAGCCSFVSRSTELPSRWHRRAAAFVGAEAFREARRLHGFPGRFRAPPELSPRKLEILQLATLGKTDIEIAMILGLKRTTVETYMAQLRQAFDVYSRTQLCMLALRFGLVGFEDAMSGF